MQLPLQRLPEEATETAFHGAPLAGQDLALAADATAVGVERADRRHAADPVAAVTAAVSASRQHLTLLRREERDTPGSAAASLPRAAAAGVRLRGACASARQPATSTNFNRRRDAIITATSSLFLALSLSLFLSSSLLLSLTFSLSLFCIPLPSSESKISYR